MVNDNILAIIDVTTGSVLLSVAARVKARRLERGWTQLYMAERSGVALASYRRFEVKGEISFRSLVMIAIALDMQQDFNLLFSQISYKSIDDVIKQTEGKIRKRGSVNGE